MPRTLTVATVQMDAAYAPLAERLARAERLIADAARDGAQLVVLPELFNLGYGYEPAQLAAAEAGDGPTAAWMWRTAAAHRVHLAGTLLLRDGELVSNSMFLMAPDGQRWRYDKRCPWAWERAFVQPGAQPMVAQTAIGAIGMLVCWDVAHAPLWRAYAGQVDLMVISSCPPDIFRPVYEVGTAQFTLAEVSPLLAGLHDEPRQVFETTVRQQTVWLGVPSVQAAACGAIRTRLPNPLGTLLATLPVAPGLVRYLPHAEQLRLRCPMLAASAVIGADGDPLMALTAADGEAARVVTLALADAPPQARGPQPRPPVNPLSYLLSDGVLPLVSRPIRRQLRRVLTA